MFEIKECLCSLYINNVVVTYQPIYFSYYANGWRKDIGRSIDWLSES